MIFNRFKFSRDREVYLIDEPVASSLETALPVTGPVGTMIIEISGGTPDFFRNGILD